MLPLALIGGAAVGWGLSRLLVLGADSGGKAVLTATPPTAAVSRTAAVAIVLVMVTALAMFRSYPYPYAAGAAGIALALLLGGYLAVERRRVAVTHIQVAQGATGVLVGAVILAETLLGLAAVGLPPAQAPEFCAWLGGERATPALLGSLRSGNMEAQLQAFQLLGSVSSSVRREVLPLTYSRADRVRESAYSFLSRKVDRDLLPVLIRGMEDPSSVVRTICADGLGKLKDPAGLPALLRAVSDPKKVGTGNNYLNAISSMGAEVRPEIARHLRGTDRALVEGAIQAALQNPTPELVAALLDRLRDRDPVMREKATEAIGGVAQRVRMSEGNRISSLFGGEAVTYDSGAEVPVLDLPAVVEALLERFSDSEVKVRAAAVRALAGAVNRTSSSGGVTVDLSDPIYDSTPVDYARISAAMERMKRDPNEAVRRAVEGSEYSLRPPRYDGMEAGGIAGQQSRVLM